MTTASDRPTSATSGFVAWRKVGKGRWQALGTYPTESQAWERIEKAMRDSPRGTTHP